MKQPNATTCVPTSLAILSRQPLDSVLDFFRSRYLGWERFETHGYMDKELIDGAYHFGLILSPFFETGYMLPLWSYPLALARYDGIVMGGKHALAKIGNSIIDPADGKSYTLKCKPYTDLTQRVFFAWTNKPPTA